MKKYSKTILTSILILVPVLIGAYLRFKDIFFMGVTGHDTFQYFEYSENLISGNPFLLFYRPLTFFFHGIGLRVLPDVDYSIKAVVAFFDVINIALVFFLTRELTKSSIFSAALATFYACTPILIKFSQTELSHTYGATVVLVLALTQVYLSRSPNWYLSKYRVFILGLIIGIAANTHESLAILSFYLGSMLIFWVVKCNQLPDRVSKIKAIALLGSVSALGFFVPYIFGMIVFGASEVINNIRQIHSTVVQTETNFFTTVYNVFYNFPVELLGKFHALVFYAVVLIGTLIVRFGKGNTALRQVMSVLIIPTAYLFLHSLFIGNVILPRLFLPFVGLVIVGTFSFFYILIFSKSSILTGASSVLVLLLAAFNFSNVLKTNFEVSEHRYLFDKLKPYVSSKSKIAIPFCYESRPPMWGGSVAYGLSGKMYFGKNAISLVTMPQQGDPIQFLKDNEVRYVLLPSRCSSVRTDQIEKYFSNVFRNNLEPFKTGEVLEISNENLLSLERKEIQNLILGINGEMVSSIDGIGDIWSLKY
jgi:hypothetical protein